MKKFFSILLFFLLTISFVRPQAVFGIGMMTKPIIIKDILRGGEFDARLTLYNSGTEAVTYKLIDSGDIKGWTTFYNIGDLDHPITRIEVPAESRIDITAQFSVPEDTPNGEYSGKVAIQTIPNDDQNSDGASANVRLGVGRDVLITVTDKEIVQFETTFIPTYDVRKGGALQIRVIYDNQGNVAVKPDLQLIITRAGETLYNAIFPYPENEEAVRARTRKEIKPIEWQTAGQENGSYKAEVKVLLDGKTVKEDEFTFTVGFDWTKFLSALAVIGGGNLMLSWFIIGGFFAVLAGVLAVYYKKPRLFKVGLANLKAGVSRIKSIF